MFDKKLSNFEGSTLKMRAIIADDHPLFRQALLLMLTQELNFEVEESFDYASTIKLMESNADYDIVFLDLNMPDANGLAGLVQIKSLFPNTLITLVSAEQNPGIIQKAIQVGISGFIPKSLNLDKLKTAVAAIMSGETWLPEDFESAEQSEEEVQYLRKLELLTPHQLRVLDMMANGLLNKQIAYELGISESTVKQHASAVLRKLGLINRTQAGVIYKQIMQTDD
ncbi:response regulator transcription factor [Glaciecola sp. 1036]|uniref:response regulator transcription factor n=1 Tax=Alteromonadaceae TaxID=72275 RepID=UPI003D03A009